MLRAGLATATCLTLLLFFPTGTVYADDEGGLKSCGGGYAPSFVIDGQVQNRLTYDLDALKQFRPTRQAVTFFAGSQGLVSTGYTGVPLVDLLAQAVVKVDPAVKNDILRKSVAVIGSDCYEAVVSLGELLSDFGGRAQIFVAYGTEDGSLLSPSDGMARLVVPSDIKGGRYVSNIARILVR